MPNSFKSLSDAFKTEPAFAGLRKIIEESDVVSEFNTIFPDLEKVASAVKVEKRVLSLKVENPTWRNELKFREKLIVDKVNDYFSQRDGLPKEIRINKIRFV